MRRLCARVFLSVLVTIALASPLLAQADAQKAYQDAKAAYAAGKFAEARDLALTASQTDPKNPEVFLLLGQAHYQLGELDEALAAWQKTLALAPEEPYSARMLAALRGEQTDVDLRIKLVQAMLREQLYAPALKECGKLLAEKALSDAQRVEVLLLQAELKLNAATPAEARQVLEELRVLHAEQADPVRLALLLGQAKLRSSGQDAVEGIAILKKLLADHAGTPAAASAQYELAAFELDQGVSQPRVDVLAKWLAENAAHPMAPAARKKLIGAYLDLTVQAGTPARDDPPGPHDVKALALAAEVYGQTAAAADAQALTQQLLAHLESYYAKNGAHAAAIQGAETLLAAPLPSASRLLVLKAIGLYRYWTATRWLNEQARAGLLPAAQGAELPKPLAEVIAAYQAIRTEYPAEPLWMDQATLAAQVQEFAAKVPWPVEVRELRGPDAWALEMALPVVKANGDPKAVDAAVGMIHKLLSEYAGFDAGPTRLLTLAVDRRLLEACPASELGNRDVLTIHVQLLDGYAKYQFRENVKAGREPDNAKLSDVEKELLATLAKHVACDAAFAPAAVQQLGEHLKPWIERGHWALAEEAYTTLAAALPAIERRQAELAVVRLWIDQVFGQHTRLAAVGLAVPRQLDPTLTKALLRCYQLQGEVGTQEAELKKVRDLWDEVVNHYTGLEYFDVAEQAVQTKPEKPVEPAEEYAQLRLVQLRDEQARRQFDASLKQYDAAEKIALSPAFKDVLAAYAKFIADRPASSLVPQATERVFGIAQLFESRGASQVAAGIYADFAKFASGVGALSASAPGAASTAQQAAFRAAQALDAAARKDLARQLADRKPDEPSPAKLSEQFAAAIAAYKGCVEAQPDGATAAEAVGKIMAVALEYAKADAWDVAEAVYADLLASKLPIRHPERLEFCRGLCKLGPALPDHAREILTALTQGGLRGSESGSGPVLLAGGRPVGGDLSDRSGAVPGAGAGPAGGPVAEGGAVTATPAPPADQPAGERDQANRDAQLLTMIRNQEASRATQVAQLRYGAVAMNAVEQQPAVQQAQQGQQAQAEQQAPPRPVLSEAELARLNKAFTAAYEVFQGIRKNFPDTPTAEQARAEILVTVSHWRSVGQWERAAQLTGRFLKDNPADVDLPKLRLEIARDRLAWASQPIQRMPSKQAMLKEVATRFQAAREELASVVADFPEERECRQEAQWEAANSFLAQARVVSNFSPTLARGQYVRAAKELLHVAEAYPDHPQIGQIASILWGISQELEAKGFFEEAILVWNDLTISYPTEAVAGQAALKIAQTYHQQLKRPLRAAEAYQELNFVRGGNDQEMQNAIFQIGTELKNEKRWVEALHLLGAFVDSFPRHPQAGQALTMIGQIHQANEAWEDAIAAYRRVASEFQDGQWVQDAKWSVAECTINLSRWHEAIVAYQAYVEAYPNDAEKVKEANRRIEVLKDLERYQALVDEPGQRKAFDAQYQIAKIVQSQLANPVKAIIEYRKVVANWPESHLADDALYEVGTAYLSLGETEKGREALLTVSQKYPTSPLADDALFMVGKSYEDEADKLATVTRAESLERNKDLAQRRAYSQARANVRQQLEARDQRIAGLKKAGKGEAAEVEEASQAGIFGQFNEANTMLFARQADQEVEALTATQLADRQDKINAALRQAVAAYTSASKVAGADKADDALLQMATIYDQRLKDSQAAMATWLEIVRQFSGTSVAEDASWRIAQYYEREGKYAEAVEAYTAFLRNYRRSPKAAEAQFAMAENYERLGQWVNAMDSYSNYITNFPEAAQVEKAKSQINWIKTYRL